MSSKEGLMGRSEGLAVVPAFSTRYDRRSVILDPFTVYPRAQGGPDSLGITRRGLDG